MSEGGPFVAPLGAAARDSEAHHSTYRLRQNMPLSWLEFLCLLPALIVLPVLVGCYEVLMGFVTLILMLWIMKESFTIKSLTL